VIAKAKGNKSIVLTTHSMEEAEVLCDRIGVMSMGEMQAVGTATELKHRFGAGYTFFIVSSMRSAEDVPKIEDFVKKLFPKSGIRPLGSNSGGTFKFEILRDDVVLSKVFQIMEDPQSREDIGLIDWSLTETTLEEVFLKLAEMSHLAEKLTKNDERQAKSKGWFQWARSMLPWFRLTQTHTAKTDEKVVMNDDADVEQGTITIKVD
jgi:ABC-type glutathione transport system ATPase component